MTVTQGFSGWYLPEPDPGARTTATSTRRDRKFYMPAAVLVVRRRRAGEAPILGDGALPDFSRPSC